MRFSSFLKFLSLFGFLAGFAGMGTIGCGQNGSDPSSLQSQNSISTNVGEMRAGSVLSIPFGADATGEIIFSGLQGNEQFVLNFYSLSLEEGKKFNAWIGGSENLEESVPPASTPLHLEQKPPLDSDSDLTASFHEHLRKAETTLRPQDFRKNPSLALSNPASELNMNAGSQRWINVLSSIQSSSSYQTIQATLLYSTPHFAAYVDNEALGAEVLDFKDIQQLVDALEAKSALMFETFGQVSDIDENGKVNIVFSPVLNRMGGGSGIVTGYFFAGDLYNSEAYSHSNQGEYIFCHVPNPGIKGWGAPISKDFYLSNTGKLCMAHELQHAINYNMKVLANGGDSADPGPYNEGQSHFAEDLYSDFKRVSEENPSRVELCLSSPYLSFIHGTSLAERGCAYLFYRYLFEQANLQRFPQIQDGKELLRRLHDQAEVGLHAVEKATGESLETLGADFFTALYLSNTMPTNDPRHQFQGINLRGDQEDNRGTRLDGPQVPHSQQFPFSGLAPAFSSQYVLIRGDQLIQNGNKLILKGNLEMKPGARLIRIGDR